MFKIEDVKAFTKELVQKYYPDLKEGCVMIYQLGKEHLLIEIFGKDDEKVGEILVNLKTDKTYFNGNGYKVEVNGTMKGMLHYSLWEGDKYYDGKAQDLYPCIALEDL